MNNPNFIYCSANPMCLIPLNHFIPRSVRLRSQEYTRPPLAAFPSPATLYPISSSCSFRPRFVLNFLQTLPQVVAPCREHNKHGIAPRLTAWAPQTTAHTYSYTAVQLIRQEFSRESKVQATQAFYSATLYARSSLNLSAKLPFGYFRFFSPHRVPFRFFAIRVPGCGDSSTESRSTHEVAV